MMPTILATIGALALAFVSGTVQADRDVAVLAPGQVVERQLDRGHVHLYQLALSAGESVRVIVEQRELDVIVEARGADGVAIAEFQNELRKGRDEPVEIVANAGGDYTLAIRPAAGVIEPGLYAIHIVSRRAATDADRAIQESRTLRTAAARLEQAGKFDEARPLNERALAIAEAVRGADDVYVAGLVRALAGNALERHEYPAAQTLYQRALAVLEKTLGAGHPETAIVQSRLALLYEHAGQRPKADVLLQQALDVIEKTLGAEHPWFVRCLATQANFRTNAGDFVKSEEIHRRALAIVEKLGDTESVLYSDLLNNLGDVYRQRQDYARAGDLFRRSLEIGERLRGPDSYYVSNALQNLGIVARERKEYATAESYYARALSIRERIVGPDHPDVAQLLNNLANIQHATGDSATALQTYFRALRIWEKALGPYHRGTLTAVGNIARTYASIGDLTNAIAFQRRADAIIEMQLGLNLAVGSERQKLALVNSVSERTDRTISLSLDEAPGDPAASALAAAVLLQRKGRVLDAMTDTFAAVRQRVTDSGDLALLDELRATTAQLARLALNAPEETRPEARENPIKELEAEKERLEAELSAHSAEVRAQLQSVTLEAVQHAIPDDAALVEFAVFRPFNPRAERNAEAYGPPRYVAYVVRKDATPRGQDLGPAKAIDAAIEALRQALGDPRRTDVKQRARAVDELVLRPLRASFTTAARLLISPDGDLNLVPFEALIDEQSHFLIERYAISYLSSGRDLLRMQVARQYRSTPVIVADPFYGEPAVASLATTNMKRASVRTPRGSVTAGDKVSTLYFAPLANTAAEGRAIKALFPESTLLTGRRATKEALAQVEGPSMLHIASHGFFLREAAQASGPGENPLLRSGLALAGANLPHDRHDDGILTALEASGLNLWGTRLVTLSACDTGVGEVRNGEGAYGLRRAFVLAGAETLVMSLWPVSDYVTRETMTAYYTGLRAGLGRGDALRQAKLAMLKQTSRQHPFYWASFIQSGEWASLDGVR